MTIGRRSAVTALLPLVATIGACLASPAAAQPVRVGALRGPADELDEAFTRITSVRELSDGRLLVAGAGEDMRLAIVDWRSGAVRTLGREGAGPGEYRSIGRVVPLGGDSTLLEDRRTGRWLLLAGERFVATGRIPIAGGGVPLLAGADARGRVLRLGGVSFGRMPGMSRPLAMVESADTVAVVRARRGERRHDRTDPWPLRPDASRAEAGHRRRGADPLARGQPAHDVGSCMAVRRRLDRPRLLESVSRRVAVARRPARGRVRASARAYARGRPVGSARRSRARTRRASG